MSVDPHEEVSISAVTKNRKVEAAALKSRRVRLQPDSAIALAKGCGYRLAAVLAASIGYDDQVVAPGVSQQMRDQSWQVVGLIEAGNHNERTISHGPRP